MTKKTNARRKLEKQLEALDKLLDLAATAKAVPSKRKERKS